MTCIHINDAKTKIEILIGSDSSIQTEMGPFLTVEESESIVAKDRFFSGDLREIKNISKKYPAIDKNLLREKLKEINLSLSQCNCLNKANESEKQKLEEEKRKLRQKESKIDENESEILLIKNENERLKRTIANLGGELTGIEKSVKGSELSSKKNELAQLISKSKGGEKG
jgi:predicted RNase H-like nuclease (RuvC/YqgF family)